jgi:DNA topoisomerase-1
MARSLVIVESPAKAKTINKYLGSSYTVKASVGHVLDLPKKTIGIRLPDEPEEQNGAPKKKTRSKKGKKAKVRPIRKPVTLDDDKIFEPTLQVIHGKSKVLNDLRRAANSADTVYLAGDPDREGEAISAHLAMVLSKPVQVPGAGSQRASLEKEEARGRRRKRQEREGG